MDDSRRRRDAERRRRRRKAEGRPSAHGSSHPGGKPHADWVQEPMPSHELELQLLNLFKIYPVPDSKITNTPEASACIDDVADCVAWAARGECEKNPDYMNLHCKISCSQCPKAVRRLQTVTNAQVEELTVPLALKGKAYINQALEELAMGSVSFVVKEWFGIDDPSPVRDTIIEVLTSTAVKLTNLDFVYPGPICSDPNVPAGVVAYVEPYGPNQKTADGKYQVMLCDYYFEVSENEKIQTLVHEAAHHEPSFAADVTYGTQLCLALAQQCAATMNYSSQQCIDARMNADTMTFFTCHAAKRKSAYPAGGSPVAGTPTAAGTAPAAGAAAGGGGSSMMIIIVVVVAVVLVCLCGGAALCMKSGGKRGLRDDDDDAQE